MHPILIRLGPFAIHAYGFMVAVAFLVGILVSIRYARKVGIRAGVILDLAIYVIFAAIAGARLLYVIGQWDHYKNNILEIFMVQRGGLAFLGGFLLVLLVIVLFAKLRKVNLLELLDVLAPGAALGYSIARIGCFLNGCCFGVPADVPWAVEFPFGALAYSYFPHERIHPTQVYAMLSMFIVFLVIVHLWKHRKYDGQVFFWWLILYSTYRFIVEFFRYCPSTLYWLGLKPGQIIALGMFAAGLAGLCLMHKRLKPGF